MKTMTFDPAQIARFWSKIDKSGPNGCWVWTGWMTPQGYGRFDLGTDKWLASHVALILTGKPRPDAPNNNALHGDHCVVACCNPDHLRWGTPKENMADRDRLGRRVALFGEAHPIAKLNEEKVRYIRSSPLTQRQLGRELGVSSVTIANVRKGRIWKHVA